MNVIKILMRNQISINGEKSKFKKINLEWWSKKENLGDYLSVVVYQWMLKNRNLDINIKKKKTMHLSAIGSLIGLAKFDAIIWGSGIHCIGSIKSLLKWRHIIKYDIRAVRGPITRRILEECNYKSDFVLGDPAILMPLIYEKKMLPKKYPYSIIQHHANQLERNHGHLISICTKDYEKFIDEIIESEIIISSSLHGIILAEAYGVPAIFLNEGMDNELIKFYDWYFSTNRFSVKIANSIEEALQLKPMPLPKLDSMRTNLIECFPYDLWES